MLQFQCINEHYSKINLRLETINNRSIFVVNNMHVKTAVDHLENNRAHGISANKWQINGRVGIILSCLRRDLIKCKG